MEKVAKTNKRSKDTLILATFPGLGKTYAAKEYPRLLDLDSMYYKYMQQPSPNAAEEWKGIRGREPNPDYPKNFIEAINSNSDKFDIILIPFVGPEIIVEYLIDNGYNCRTVICGFEMVEEMLERFRKRNNSEVFIADAIRLAPLLIEQYSKPRYRPIIAKQGEYLIDILKRERLLK